MTTDDGGGDDTGPAKGDDRERDGDHERERYYLSDPPQGYSAHVVALDADEVADPDAPMKFDAGVTALCGRTTYSRVVPLSDEELAQISRGEPVRAQTDVCGACRPHVARRVDAGGDDDDG